MNRRRWRLVVSAGLLLATRAGFAADVPVLVTDAKKVAALLTRADVWIMPQPKTVAVTGEAFDLHNCQGICLAGKATEAPTCAGSLPALLQQSSGVSVGFVSGPPKAGQIVLGVFPDGVPTPGFPKATAADLKGLGQQGYWLSVDKDGIAAAATAPLGLYYAVRTIGQISTDRTKLPGLVVRDWPSLQYRGVQDDISRGQVPTLATLKRFCDVVAVAKMNICELYIENVFKWKKYPDIGPPESITAEEGRALFDCAARYNMEVHPMLQVLGHSYGILSLPPYQRLRVGPCKREPWLMTFDIRKPEVVAFVCDLVREVCEAFPGKFLNVDVTEVDIEGLKATGTTEDQALGYIYDYLLKLRETIKPYGMRLMVAQGPLSSIGALSGLERVIDKVPKDIVITSYYTAPPGAYGTAWEKDFPLLRKQGLDFWAMPWIESHNHIMPDTGRAADFSDGEVRKGLEFGAKGSVTTDWGDDGHYHLTGQIWYPCLYHGACAWTGAKMDRTYFNHAFCRLIYGVKDERIATAINLLGGINSQKVKCYDDKKQPVEQMSNHYWEFWHDPFTGADIVPLVDPAATGRDIRAPAAKAIELLKAADKRAIRNRDNIEQLIFGARNYQAMGDKLILVGHFRDKNYPRRKLAEELSGLVGVYEGLRTDFSRLWLAEDRENSGYRTLMARFNETIVPCQQKAAELAK
jgi:hexosaminidase